MRRRIVFGIVGLMGLLTACRASPGKPALSEQVPTVSAAATRIETATPTVTAVPATETPTQMPAPATPTTAPTSTTLPPPTSTPAPTLTPTPTPTVDPFACRPAAELAGVQPVHRLLANEWPRPSASEGVVGVGPNNGFNLIHLGFDVEGSPAHLGELLDVLDRHGVKTTFFILGSWAETYPGWVQAFVNRGHELGNHTYSHANLKPMISEEVLAEIQRTETAVQQITGQSTKPWLRPPFGSRSETSVQTAFENGWTTVAWTGSADDWREETTEDMMCRTLRSTAFPGAILYTHTFRPEIPAVVDRFIGEMQSRGFTFVPLSILMSSNPGQYLTQ